MVRMYFFQKKRKGPISSFLLQQCQKYDKAVGKKGK